MSVLMLLLLSAHCEKCLSDYRHCLTKAVLKEHTTKSLAEKEKQCQLQINKCSQKNRCEK